MAATTRSYNDSVIPFSRAFESGRWARVPTVRIGVKSGFRRLISTLFPLASIPKGTDDGQEGVRPGQSSRAIPPFGLARTNNEGTQNAQNARWRGRRRRPQKGSATTRAPHATSQFLKG